MNVTSASAQNQKSQTIWCFEWLRVAACLAVILIHCFATVLNNYPVSEVGVPRALGWTVTLVILGRWAVPAFLMISGALLLNPEKEVGYAKSFAYAKRIVIVLFTFGTLFALMELVFNAKSLSALMLPEAFLNVLQGKSWAHLWYLYDLLGIYLILPILKSFVNGARKRSLELFIGILFVFTCFIPTINGAFGLGIKNVIWFGTSVFYFVLGYYLYSYVELNPTVATLGIGAVVIEALLVGWGIVQWLDYTEWAWGTSSCFVSLWASAIFLFAKKYADKEIRNNLIQSIGSLSFCIYVVHPIFTNLLFKVFGWASAPIPSILYELITFVLVFCGACALSFVLKKLPLLGRCL